MMRKYIRNNTFQTAKLTRIIAKLVDFSFSVAVAFFLYPVGIFIAVFYLSIKDSLFNGQSLGKRYIGFSVISLEDGSPCSLKQSIIRNLPFSIPLFFSILPFWGWIFSAILSSLFIGIELYLLFKLDSGHRIGDVMADTSVIAPQEKLRVNTSQKSWFPSEEKA